MNHIVKDGGKGQQGEWEKEKERTWGQHILRASHFFLFPPSVPMSRRYYLPSLAHVHTFSLLLTLSPPSLSLALSLTQSHTHKWILLTLSLSHLSLSPRHTCQGLSWAALRSCREALKMGGAGCKGVFGWSGEVEGAVLWCVFALSLSLLRCFLLRQTQDKQLSLCSHCPFFISILFTHSPNLYSSPFFSFPPISFLLFLSFPCAFFYFLFVSKHFLSSPFFPFVSLLILFLSSPPLSCPHIPFIPPSLFFPNIFSPNVPSLPSTLIFPITATSLPP